MGHSSAERPGDRPVQTAAGRPGSDGSFASRSYALHAKEAEELAGRLPSIICDPDSMDAFFHRRCYGMIGPIAKRWNAEAWLTVGDMGADAFYLRQCGVRNVTCSSLSDAQIKHVAALGHLPGISVAAVNGEATGLADLSVDFVLVKEALHHFPRPMFAFYELWRIARHGLVLIEPTDGPPRLLDGLRKIVKLLLRGQSFASQEFECTGNFLYRLSTSEIYKALAAMQGGGLAYRRFNQFYVARLVTGKSRFWRRSAFYLGVAIQNMLCAVRLMTPGLVACYVSKMPFSPSERSALKQAGYQVVDIPANPYLARAT